MTKANEFDDLFNATVSQQAERIIARFGGVPKLVAALEFVGYKVSRFSVYKWTYPKSKPGYGGTNGLIPLKSKPWVVKAAQALGIFISPQDWNA